MRWWLCWRENNRNEVVMEKSRHVLVVVIEGSNEKELRRLSAKKIILFGATKS